MGSLCNENGVNEVKITVQNNGEQVQKSGNSAVGKKPEEVEIPPLDVKDYEDLGLIIDLEELREGSYENSYIDFNTMFTDFNFPEDEPMLELSLPHGIDEKDILDPPPLTFPIPDPSLMELQRWMDIDPPEFKLHGGAGEPSLSGDPKNWDFELMQWLWHPHSYQDFLRFYHG